MNQQLLETALACIKAGLSVIPIDHASKRPVTRLLPRGDEGKPTWKPFQHRLASPQEVRGWCEANIEAIAVVCGRVSGGRPGFGLLVIDFDEPDFASRWGQAVGTLARDLVVQRTGGGGFQALVRCPNPGGNDKLAWTADSSQALGKPIAIETRGEGGYAVIAPSLHPSGNRYQWLTSPDGSPRRDIAHIATVTQEAADELLAAARAMDACGTGFADPGFKAHEPAGGGGSVIERFNREHAITMMLELHGYRPGVTGRYIRPGGTAESVSILDTRSCHWSSNDPLNNGKGRGGCGVHDAFSIYCHFEHGGNARAAVKAFAAGGAKAEDDGSTQCRDEVAGECSDAPPTRPAASLTPAFMPFPTHLLPAPLARFVQQASAATGCDPAYVALPMLAQAAAAIGNSRRIRLKRSWTEPPVLWTVVIGDSGTLKSPAFDLALRPTRRRQQLLIDQFRESQTRHAAAMDEHDLAMKEWHKLRAGQRPQTPREPVCERLWCGDTTVEALAHRLNDAPRGLLLARDELAGWLSSFNQYKAGQGGDVAHWLEMHRAGALMVDRKTGDQTTIHVPRAAVCVTGGIQPQTLRRCLTPDFFDNGLAARLLLAMPPRRTRRWTDHDLDDAALDGLNDVMDKLWKLQPMNAPDLGQQPMDVMLGDDARAAWVDFYNRHAAEQDQLHDQDLSAAWSKLEGYAARLALVLHCCRLACGESGEASRCDLMSMRGGIELASWFGHEARRVYMTLNDPVGSDHRQSGLVGVIKALGGQATCRDLARHCRLYRTAADYRAALDALAERGVGRWQAEPYGNGLQRFVFHLLPSRTDTLVATADSVDTPTR